MTPAIPKMEPLWNARPVYACLFGTPITIHGETEVFAPGAFSPTLGRGGPDVRATINHNREATWASVRDGSVTDPHRFSSARQFAASLGLTPRADSSGGKERLGRISKMGARYLRCLLVNGMPSQLQAARRKPEAHPWFNCSLRRRPHSLDKVHLI